jgi:hypothetical protein
VLHDRHNITPSLVLAFSWYSREAAHAHMDLREEHDTTSCQCSGRKFAIGRTLKMTTLGIIPTGSEALSGNGTQNDGAQRPDPRCLSQQKGIQGAQKYDTIASLMFDQCERIIPVFATLGRGTTLRLAAEESAKSKR